MSPIPHTPTIIASGPSTCESLAAAISRLSDAEHLCFYDAISPTIEVGSINTQIIFRASR